jgi:hypothetical protein
MRVIENKLFTYFLLDKKVTKNQDSKSFAKNELRSTKTNDIHVEASSIRLLRSTTFIFFTQNILCRLKEQFFLCAKASVILLMSEEKAQNILCR